MLSFPYRKYIDKLIQRSGYSNLQRREQLLIGVAALLLLSIILFQFMVQPLLESQKRLRRAVSRKQQELVKIETMRQEYMVLKTKAGGVQARLSRRARGFSLFSFIDEQATETKVKGQVKSMKPSTNDVDDVLQESVVEIKLSQITLRQLVSFLTAIESEENVIVVKRLSVQKNSKEKDYLDVVLQVMTFVFKGAKP